MLAWILNFMTKVHPYIVVLIRCILGIVFVYASYQKILDPAKFSRDISNYHIVPFGLENIVALIIPWLELLIGIGLISGIMVDGASLISGGLFVLFIILISQAIIRGYNIECGCGLKEGEMVGWIKVIENLFYLAASYLVWKRDKTELEFFPKTTLSE